MANFGSKPWTNPFGKNLNFATIWTCCFHSLVRRFFLLEYPKQIFVAYIAQNKKLEKWPILDQNYGLTPLENSQFFDFLNFLFL